MSEILQGTLGEFVTQISGGGTPARDIAEYWTGKIPWISVKDLTSSNPESTAERISEQGLASSASRLIPAGIPIVATRMAVGRSAVFSSDVAINQDLKAIFPNEELLHRNYLFQFGSSRQTRRHLPQREQGALSKGYDWKTWSNCQSVFPPSPSRRRSPRYSLGLTRKSIA